MVCISTFCNESSLPLANASQFHSHPNPPLPILGWVLHKTISDLFFYKVWPALPQCSPKWSTNQRFWIQIHPMTNPFRLFHISKSSASIQPCLIIPTMHLLSELNSCFHCRSFDVVDLSSNSHRSLQSPILPTSPHRMIQWWLAQVGSWSAYSFTVVVPTSYLSVCFIYLLI